MGKLNPIRYYPFKHKLPAFTLDLSRFPGSGRRTKDRKRSLRRKRQGDGQGPVKVTYLPLLAQPNRRRPNVKDELKPAFVNDNYLGLSSLSMFMRTTRGAKRSGEANQKFADRKGYGESSYSVKYPAEVGGYTAGRDTWDLYVGFGRIESCNSSIIAAGPNCRATFTNHLGRDTRRLPCLFQKVAVAGRPTGNPAHISSRKWPSAGRGRDKSGMGRQ